tara:strand:+ start:993 stop:1244 length:252 start_codon:yes stop_codon:yes gene_type:complete
MAKTILNFLIGTMGIFSDERRRHFSKELLEKDQEVKDQENARFPDYNDDKLALAREALESFLVAYQSEFDVELKKLKAGVVSE